MIAFGRGSVLAFAIATTTPAIAQTNERIYENLQFRTVTPGARAVAMGKTFIGLADDATAAASNPAGLSNLLEPEISAEVLVSDPSHTRLVSTAIGSGSPTDMFAQFGTASILPSFASIALPKGRSTFAVFYNSGQRYRESFEFGKRCNHPVTRPLDTSCENGEYGDLDVSVSNYGLGGALVVVPWLSVGASLVLAHLSLDSDGNAGTAPSRVNGVSIGQPPKNGTFTHLRSTRPSGYLGVLAKPIPRTAIGASYYRGMTFSGETHLFGDFFNVGVFPVPVARPIDYVIPDRAAVGASVRGPGGFTVLGEVARVWHSKRVTKNFQVVDFGGQGYTRDNFYYDDVTEYHLGAEYLKVIGSRVLAIRGGWFKDGDQQLHFRVVGAPQELDDAFNFRQEGYPKQRYIGYTAGLGVTLGNRLQLDAAMSLQNEQRELVLSLVRRLR